jgi:hypothetical protein
MDDEETRMTKLPKVFVVRLYRAGRRGEAEGVIEPVSGGRRQGFRNSRELWDALAGSRRVRPPAK